jgi:hypothetical protein
MTVARALAIFSIVLAVGQAVALDIYKSDGRFYSGEPRPVEQVALLVGNVWDPSVGTVCPNFRTITEAGNEPKALFLGKTMAEVLPGHYTVEIGCTLSRFTTVNMGATTVYAPTVIEIDAKAGHVYYVWVDRKKGMNPIVVDVGQHEDYKQIKNGSFIEGCVNKYFRGKRHEVQVHEVTPKSVTTWN